MLPVFIRNEDWFGLIDPLLSIPLQETDRVRSPQILRRTRIVDAFHPFTFAWVPPLYVRGAMPPAVPVPCPAKLPPRNRHKFSRRSPSEVPASSGKRRPFGQCRAVNAGSSISIGLTRKEHPPLLASPYHTRVQQLRPTGTCGRVARVEDLSFRSRSYFPGVNHSYSYRSTNIAPPCGSKWPVLQHSDQVFEWIALFE